MSRDLALLSTDELEKAARHPRGREDARAIAEELAARRQLYARNDQTLPLPLFAEAPSSKHQGPTGNPLKTAPKAFGATTPIEKRNSKFENV